MSIPPWEDPKRRYSDRMPAFKKQNAKSMRRYPTEAEAALWKMLRRRGIGGVKFKRQTAMYGYIADFYAPSARLVVEVDGEYHADRAELDAARDWHLLRNAIRTIRVTNEDVLKRPVEVRARILQAIEWRQ